jgi:uncharacterized membrane protein YkoI
MNVRTGMRTRTARWLAGGVALGVAWHAAELEAQPRPDPATAIGAEIVDAVPAQNIIAPNQISLEQAIEIALRSNPGRVVRADTKTQGTRTVHEIRILGADNRVRTVRIDAQSGGPL